MRRLPIILLALLVVAGAGTSAYLWHLGSLQRDAMRAGETVIEPVPIGGAFSLIDQNGTRRSEQDFRGKLMLVFFGYTYCPDVCPTTLAFISDALEKAGPTARDVIPVMITVDPARDKPEALKSYLASFGPQFVGLTGSEEEIAAAAKAYKVYYRKAGEGADAMFDHSSIIYLMDRQGRFLAHYQLDPQPGASDAMAKDLKAKIAAAS
jgi:protein SCO1